MNSHSASSTIRTCRVHSPHHPNMVNTIFLTLFAASAVLISTYAVDAALEDAPPLIPFPDIPDEDVASLDFSPERSRQLYGADSNCNKTDHETFKDIESDEDD